MASIAAIISETDASLEMHPLAPALMAWHMKCSSTEALNISTAIAGASLLIVIMNSLSTPGIAMLINAILGLIDASKERAC